MSGLYAQSRVFEWQTVVEVAIGNGNALLPAARKAPALAVRRTSRSFESGAPQELLCLRTGCSDRQSVA